jgi:hypothetical protein
MAETSTEADLMTIIDFCHEMVLRYPIGRLPEVADCHDLAHVILGGDKTREWDFEDAMAWDVGATEAWPDVKRRMATLLAKSQAVISR